MEFERKAANVIFAKKDAIPDSDTGEVKKYASVYIFDPSDDIQTPDRRGVFPEKYPVDYNEIDRVFPKVPGKYDITMHIVSKDARGVPKFGIKLAKLCPQ